ncbi:MAG TPA: glycosyltransferase family 39 protein [Terriglobales bacterium]|nr:glycosyltransferase family 39 protein [Terriglobales bacterium]
MNNRRQLVEVLTVAAFVAFLFYFGLGAFGLLGADEPRYAQVAREMLARHDWITPYLYGKPWLEKPALYYWRAMFAMETFGVHDWTARLPSATFATAMIAIVYYHMRRFRPGAQLDAALMTASCAAIVGFARAASTDMQLAAPFAIGMLGWYAWQETGSKVWLFDFYFFIGIGTLAKGPVAPGLAVLIVAAYALLHRDWRMIWRTAWWPGIALYCAVILPWYISVQIRNPNFLRVFFLQHNLERFASDLFHHRQPFWYYLPILALALLPWTTMVVAAITDAVRHRIWRYPNPRSEDGFPLFLILWGVIPVVFFSFSQSKLPGYILPAVPPWTILAADYLRREREADESPPVAFLVAHALLAAMFMGGVMLAPYIALRETRIPAAPLAVAIALAVITFLGIFLTIRRRGLAVLRFVTLVPVIVGVAFLLRVAAPRLDAALSSRPLAGQLATLDAGKSPVAVFRASRNVEYGLAFYRNHEVYRYERDEIPAEGHIVVAPEGSIDAIREQVPGRRVSFIGNFAPQHLDLYWVFPPGAESMHK